MINIIPARQMECFLKSFGFISRIHLVEKLADGVVESGRSFRLPHRSHMVALREAK